MLEQDLVLKSDDLFYVGRPLETIRDRAAGLYSRDTRHLNGIQILLNGRVPEMLAVNTHHASAATIVSANPALSLNGDDNLLLPHQVAIEQRLSLDTRLHISYVLQNYSTLSLPLRFGLQLSADFDDVFEVRGYKRKERGTLLRPHAHQGAVRLRYRACDDTIVETLISFDRIPQITLRAWSSGTSFWLACSPRKARCRGSRPRRHGGRAGNVSAHAGTGGRWELRVRQPGISEYPGQVSVPVSLGQSTADRASITTDNPFFNRLLSRSLDDLAALVSRFPDGHLVAAGIPWFVAPFGRDSLIAGLQTVHVAPRDAEGTLRVLASLQGARRDAFTEEQPGKIPHEMRYGEMARTGEVPHRPYYGSIDSTSLFVLLAETVAWTGTTRFTPASCRLSSWR